MELCTNPYGSVLTDVNYYNKTYRIDEMTHIIGDRVILEIIEQDRQEEESGIIIPDEVKKNKQMLKGKIIHLGSAAKVLGLNEGDIVLYDRWSCYFKPPFVFGLKVITEVGNILGVHVED